MPEEVHIDALPPGSEVGGYVVRRVLGQGGFGITYEAASATGVVERKVAIKEFFPAKLAQRKDGSVVLSSRVDRVSYAAALRRFEVEARRLVDVYDHPGIVRGENVVRAHGSVFFVMEYVEGEMLADRIARQGPLDAAAFRSFFEGVLDAVDYLHGHGAMHRDLSPRNIMIRTARRGRPTFEPVLIDFGAMAEGLDLVRDSTVAVANPSFAPPEQQEPDGGAQGRYTDLFALGGVMYYALTGRAPVKPMARLSVSARSGVDPLVPFARAAAEAGVAVDPVVAAAIDAALALDPADRPADVFRFKQSLGWIAADAEPPRPAAAVDTMMIADLGAVADDMTGLAGRPDRAPSGTTPTAPMPEAQASGASVVAPARRRRAGIAVAAAGLAFGALGFGGFVMKPDIEAWLGERVALVQSKAPGATASNAAPGTETREARLLRETKAAIDASGRTTDAAVAKVGEAVGETRQGVARVETSVARVEDKVAAIAPAVDAARDSAEKAAAAADKVAAVGDRLAVSVDEMSKRFAALANAGGMIAEPHTPPEFYSNARLAEMKGDGLAARRAHLALAGLDLDAIDPWFRFATLLRVQDGRAGAREVLASLEGRAKSRAYRLASLTLKDDADRRRGLADFVAANPDYGPAWYVYADEFSEARVGSQTLAEKRRERDALARFVAADDQGALAGFFLDRSQLADWLDGARRRIARLDETLSRSADPTVKFTRSNAGWTAYVQLPEPALGFAYRLDGRSPFVETTAGQITDPRTGRPYPNTLISIAAGAEPPAIEVRYTDVRNETVGPFTLKFDPLKSLLDDARAALEMTKGAWVEFGRGNDLLYVTHLVSYRCAIAQASFGLDDAAPDRPIALPPCDTRDPYAIPNDFKPYFRVPGTARAATVRLTYQDGTSSQITIPRQR